jgi:hypothetical protein
MDAPQIPTRKSFFLGLAVMALLQLVPRMKLGFQGLEVSYLGLGCMGMCSFDGPARLEEEIVEWEEGEKKHAFNVLGTLV